MYWYFLNIQFDNADPQRSDELADALIKHGTELKKLLKQGGYTDQNTLSVCVGDETCFDVWLDAGGHMQVEKLKPPGEREKLSLYKSNPSVSIFNG